MRVTAALVLVAMLAGATRGVELAEIHFNAEFRSRSAAGKISLGEPEFRAPDLQRALAPEQPVDSTVDSVAELIAAGEYGNPFAHAPAAQYANASRWAQFDNGQANWSSKPITSVGTDIALPIPLPTAEVELLPSPDCVACECCFCDRGWAGLCYCFAATGLCYNPLYFEEPNLERYGYGCYPCLQSAASAAHFFGRVPLLPYMMATDCPWHCNYALGHYRPGSCAPWRRHCLPITGRGALAQGGAITGLVFLLP